MYTAGQEGGAGIHAADENLWFDSKAVWSVIQCPAIALACMHTVHWYSGPHHLQTPAACATNAEYLLLWRTCSYVSWLLLLFAHQVVGLVVVGQVPG
jgi:hypothetical protein